MDIIIYLIELRKKRAKTKRKEKDAKKIYTQNKPNVLQRALDGVEPIRFNSKDQNHKDKNNNNFVLIKSRRVG